MSGVCSCRRFITLLVIIVALLLGLHLFMPRKSILDRIGEDGFLESLANKGLNLTESEQTAFAKFKERMVPKIGNISYLQHDVFLVKWLQVADFDIEEAEKSLTESLEWRTEEKLDTIHDEDWSDILPDYEYNIKEVDNNGRPILYVNFGAWNIKEAVKSGKRERLERFVVKMIDEAVNLVHQKYKASGEVTQYWLLIQLEDFNYFQAACIKCIPVIMKLAKVFEYQYPRMGYQIIAVNTPGIFSLLFNIIRPILSETTKENCHLLGDREEWEPVLKVFGVHQLEVMASEE